MSFPGMAVATMCPAVYAAAPLAYGQATLEPVAYPLDSFDDLIDCAAPAVYACADERALGHFLQPGDGRVCAADSSCATPPTGASRLVRTRRQRNVDAQQRQRRAANERERRRMLSINRAFNTLRVRIPTLPYEKRLSKVDTLRQAIDYIHSLEDMIRSDEELRAVSGDATSGGGRASRGAAFTLPRMKKVIVECHSGDDGHLGLPPLRGHSLGWARKDESLHNATLNAKVWTPAVLNAESKAGDT